MPPGRRLLRQEAGDYQAACGGFAQVGAPHHGDGRGAQLVVRLQGAGPAACSGVKAPQVTAVGNGKMLGVVTVDLDDIAKSRSGLWKLLAAPCRSR